MSIIKKMIAGIALAAVFLVAPGLSLAHEGKSENKDKRAGLELFGRLKMHRGLKGSVSAVSSTSFTLQVTKNGTTTPYTINTANAKIMKAFGIDITLADIQVGDKAEVNGSVNGTTMEAKTVIISPANTHRAVGKGTVTAVNGSQITVQQNNHGIVSSFTVSTNASTTVIGQNGNATTTAAIQTGLKVKVKGLWNEITNALTAAWVKIK